MANKIGIEKKGFIYIPEQFEPNKKWLIIFNELALSFESKIVSKNDLSVHIQSKLKVLSEDEKGTDTIREHNLEYTLELENGKIVGGSWIQHSFAPIMIWKPDEESRVFDFLKRDNFLRAFQICN